MKRLAIRNLLRKSIDGVIERYWDDLPLDVCALKTEAYYNRVLSKGVRDLYNGRISEDDLLTTMARLLDEQMRRAWNEGARENGWTMPDDMTPEWEAELQGIIDSEFAHVQQFIADVTYARDNAQPIQPLLDRVDLWANRYNDVVNQAKLSTAEPKDKYEWIYGDTDHCETCAGLNGIVATAGEWEQAMVWPQRPPNGQLECGGWRCQCRLEPTDKRHTTNAYDRIIAVVLGGPG